MTNSLTKIFLLRLARRTIAELLKLDWETYLNAPEDIQAATSDIILTEYRGTFVTLTKEDELRGCIGQIQPNESIIDTIKENTISAAFRDYRFPPLSKNEFMKTIIEISILTKPEEIEYTNSQDLLDKIINKKDGIIIKKGVKTATFLPQVWDDLEDKKEFLTQLCIKAKLEPFEWENEKLIVKKYNVEHFSEDEFNLVI